MDRTACAGCGRTIPLAMIPLCAACRKTTGYGYPDDWDIDKLRRWNRASGAPETTHTGVVVETYHRDKEAQG